MVRGRDRVGRGGVDEVPPARLGVDRFVEAVDNPVRTWLNG
ncbi:hypothetical protein ACIBJE_19615 [Micromonospora sp. NPDC050187]